MILPLDLLGLNLQQYIDRLHTIILGVLEEFDLSATVGPERSGVFSGPARIATVGVAVNRWIAYHGMTLNVGPFLELFDVLDEPGTGGAPVRQTSMEARRQRQTPMPKVRESFLRKIEESFGLERLHLYTDHPQIKRKVLSHVYAPSSG